MFEKIRIKEHMEVADTNGQHVGTVDHVEGDLIRLTKADSADGRHHCVPIAAVKKIEGDRVYIEPGTATLSKDEAAAIAGGDPYPGPQPTDSASREEPLFGTSGHGTGMGGSGVGR